MAGLSFDTASGLSNKEANVAFKKQLNKVYAWYTGGFFIFIVLRLIPICSRMASATTNTAKPPVYQA